MRTQAPQETTLAQRLSQIQQKIRQHTKSAFPAELIAVSKLQPIGKIRELYQLGQTRFGENYAQELGEKAEALKDLPIHWIFIGHIQSNKLKKIVQHSAEIQTVASLAQAQAIERHALEFGKAPYPIMIEVNAGDEASKSGVPRGDVLALAETIARTCPELRIRGLMAIPPDAYSDANCDEVPLLYRELRALADEVGEGRLSLGMSNDLRIAVEAGTDMVRVGTALLGSRG